MKQLLLLTSARMQHAVRQYIPRAQGNLHSNCLLFRWVTGDVAQATQICGVQRQNGTVPAAGDLGVICRVGQSDVRQAREEDNPSDSKFLVSGA
jgi:hypothetical protein